MTDTTGPMLIALLLYPGMVFAAVLGLCYARLSGGSAGWQRIARQRTGMVHAARQSVEGWTSLVSSGLSGVALALLPWPWHPLAIDPIAALWAWSVLEVAFLVALLPGLLAGAPLVVRAAMREAQIGVMGRALLWLALAPGLVLFDQWQLIGDSGHSPMLLHALALVLALIVWPVAAGWGPAAAETSMTPGGLAAGLDDGSAALAQSAQTMRQAVLLGATLLLLLPVALLPPWLALLLLLLVFALVSWFLGRMVTALPRLTLPDLLHWCWWRALPLGLIGVLYLSLV
ncbi:MAG: hypothetical protein HC837_15160 [Chloroflexaceae bacterium]|nr:hypothetical protein [Chloroflexaceae bacterium]